MKNFGISGKLVKLIQMCNEQISWKAQFLEKSSIIFERKTGLRQGDAMSSVFHLASEKVMIDI